MKIAALRVRSTSLAKVGVAVARAYEARDAPAPVSTTRAPWARAATNRCSWLSSLSPTEVGAGPGRDDPPAPVRKVGERSSRRRASPGRRKGRRRGYAFRRKPLGSGIRVGKASVTAAAGEATRAAETEASQLRGVGGGRRGVRRNRVWELMGLPLPEGTGSRPVLRVNSPTLSTITCRNRATASPGESTAPRQLRTARAAPNATAPSRSAVRVNSRTDRGCCVRRPAQPQRSVPRGSYGAAGPRKRAPGG